MPHEGHFVLNFDADTGQVSPRALACTFQVADLARPLMSVSQLCELGFQCMFKYTHALVIDSAGETVGRFEWTGQLYTTQMILKAPESFPRPS